MYALRNARPLARFVLLWFMLALGAAVASPLIKPQAVQFICTGSGAIKVLRLADDGTVQTGGHLLECPLCVVSGAPPPAATTSVQPSATPAHVSDMGVAALLQARCAPALPARGPPATT